MNNLDFITAGHTFIIAEAGVNHNGNIDVALDLIDAAAGARADAVKFQTFKAEGVATIEARKAEYQERTTGSSGDQLSMLRELELPEDWYPTLINRCKEKGIMFLSTAHDWGAIDVLDSLSVNAFKVGSGDLTNIPFLKKLATKNRPIIISTGMGNIGEVEEAVEAIRESGNGQLAVLHCVTSYPAEVEDINLRAMDTIKRAFGVTVGYSDHTNGITVALAAVALGAQIIEKHFTLDRTMPGPDHQASLEPNELTQLVAEIRVVEKALGDGVKRPVEREKLIQVVARKSIVAACDIPSGSTITEGMLTTKRPGSGIRPKYWINVVGQKASCDITKDSLLDWYQINWSSK